MNTENTNIPKDFTFDSIYVDNWRPENSGDSISGTIVMVGEKYLKDDYVPFIEIATEDGEAREILMSSAPLKALFLTGELQEGRRIAIRYDGESSTIQNAGNYMKKWSFALWTEKGDKIDLRYNLQKMRTFQQHVESDDDLKRKLNEAQDTIRSHKESASNAPSTSIDFEKSAEDDTEENRKNENHKTETKTGKANKSKK